MKTLGFIGTGGMGSGMAANLIKAGYSLVVNDIRREVARNLESQGAEFKASLYLASLTLRLKRRYK